MILPLSAQTPLLTLTSPEAIDLRLHNAAECGDSGAVRELLDAGVSPNVRDGLEQTALLRAAWWGHDTIVQLLIKAGIEVNAKSELGFDALFWAVEHGHGDVVATLLAAGANVHAKGLHGWTALHAAAQRADSTLYRQLVARGADEQLKDAFGRTPAMIFAEQRSADIIARWQPCMQKLDWQKTIVGIEPKITPCGHIYEIAGSDKTLGFNESFAIADMRAITCCTPHYHANNEVEIYFVLQGTGLVVVGGQERMVQPGDIVVTPPNTVHYVLPKKDLVLGIINTPPFDERNFIVVQESDSTVQFDKEQFDRLTEQNKGTVCSMF